MLQFGVSTQGLWPQTSRRGLPSLGGLHRSVGQSPAYDAGTDGDWFVDGANGDDTWPGTSPEAPFATIGAAIDAAQTSGGTQTVRIMGDGHIYREANALSWNQSALTGLTITGYGTDRPVVSGAKALSGFAPCTAADAAIAGSNWSQLRKLTVSKADYPLANTWRTILCEGTRSLDLCGVRKPARTTPDFFFDNNDQLFDANDYADLTITLRGGQYYDTLAHPGALGSFTDPQLEQSTAAVWRIGNGTEFLAVNSVSGGVLTFEPVDVTPQSGTDGAYALLNVLPAIEQGQWGYRDNGDGTITFYIWPYDPKVTQAEIAIETFGLRILRGLNDTPVTIENIDFEMFAHDGVGGNALEINNLIGLTGCPASVRECSFRRCAGQACLLAKFVEQAVTVERCTFRESVSFGLMTLPSSGAPSVGNRIRQCLAQDLSQTGFRMFGCHDMVMSDIVSVRTSGGGHANAINFYGNCDRIAVVNYRGALDLANRLYEGYATNQSASRLYFLHCTFTPASDGRGYVDQTIGGEVLPTVGANSHLVNCWVPHMPDRLASPDAGGITVGRDVHSWSVTNCVAPAIVNTGGTVLRANNLLTNSTVTGGTGEQLAGDIDAVFADVDRFRFEAVPASQLNAMPGADVETTIQTLEGWFPGEDFRRDAAGRAWNPASPGIGPYAGNWPERPAKPPPPVVLNAELVANGTFDSDLSGWSIGSGFSAQWNAGTAEITRGSGLIAEGFKQIIPDLAIGGSYELSFTISGTGTAVYVRGADAWGPTAVSGTQTRQFIAASDELTMSFWGSTGAIAVLDDVSLKRIG